MNIIKILSDTMTLIFLVQVIYLDFYISDLSRFPTAHLKDFKLTGINAIVIAEKEDTGRTIGLSSVIRLTAITMVLYSIRFKILFKNM